MCILVCQPRGCPHSPVCLPLRPAQLVEKVANRDVWDFGWGGCSPGRFTRHPPISLYTMITRTGGYAYAVGVWDLSLDLSLDLSIVQGPFSVAPCQTWCTHYHAEWGLGVCLQLCGAMSDEHQAESRTNTITFPPGYQAPKYEPDLGECAIAWPSVEEPGPLPKAAPKPM
jgi:hypothetical protein